MPASELAGASLPHGPKWPKPPRPPKPPRNLGPALLLAGPSAEDSVRWLKLFQSHAGLPVLQANLTVAVKNNHVVYVAGRALAPVSLSPRPNLSASAALARLSTSLGAFPLRAVALLLLQDGHESRGVVFDDVGHRENWGRK